MGSKESALITTCLPHATSNSSVYYQPLPSSGEPQSSGTNKKKHEEEEDKS